MTGGWHLPTSGDPSVVGGEHGEYGDLYNMAANNGYIAKSSLATWLNGNGFFGVGNYFYHGSIFYDNVYSTAGLNMNGGIFVAGCGSSNPSDGICGILLVHKAP